MAFYSFTEIEIAIGVISVFLLGFVSSWLFRRDKTEEKKQGRKRNRNKQAEKTEEKKESVKPQPSTKKEAVKPVNRTDENSPREEESKPAENKKAEDNDDDGWFDYKVKKNKPSKSKQDQYHKKYSFN